MSDILIIKAPFILSKKAMKEFRDKVLEEMETGLVVLPEGFSVALCPKDVEVQFMDSRGNNSCPVDPVILDKLCENPGYILSKEEIEKAMEEKDGT